jgi:hypothetical protein
MCIGCNGILEKRFESRTAQLVQSLFVARGDVVLEADDATAVALWFMKTWLLLAHPEVNYSQPHVNDLDIVRWKRPLPSGYYDWLIVGSQPPQGLSLWLSRTQYGGYDPPTGPIIPLPTVRADGKTTSFEVLGVSRHGLTATLVFHPDWDIEHPHEIAGRAVRLWPRRSTGNVDLGGLEPFSYADVVRWLRCRVCLKDGAIGSANLPPLTSVANLFELMTGRLRPFVGSVGM